MTTDERPAALVGPDGGSRRGGRVTRRRVLVAVVAGAPAALVLLSDVVDLDRYLPFAVFAALRPTLAAGVGIAAAAGLVLRRRWWPVLAPVLAVAVVAGALVVPRAVPDDPPPSGGTDLTVLELNVYEGKADLGTVASLVRAEQPDVVVLPEAGEPFRRRIAALTPGYRAWTNAPPAAPDVRGIVVLTSPRAGDVTARRVDLGSRYPWAELTGGILGPVRLLAVHVVSVVPEWISYWPEELTTLRGWCGAPGPAMVVGDFNASLDHSAFRAGAAGCDDAASRTGDGLTGTWYSGAPRWAGSQIDHVLTHPGTDGTGPAARSFRVIDVPGSDHRATLTHLRLR